MPDILSSQELARFNRHIILPQVGQEGQEKLKQARVLCIGTGGLGSPIALYLAAAGIGKIGLVDFDVVDESNLQRQIIHSTSTIGTAKVESAKQRLLEINPYIDVALYPEGIKRDNVRQLVKNYDVIVDGTDNFPTRYLVNDACVLENKPLVYASIFQFEGQATVFHFEDGPCYRCLYPEPPPPGLVPSCAEGGVLGVLPGVIGVIQCTEAIKIILDIGGSLSGRLLLYDALNMSFREVRLRKDPHCPACGDHPSIGDVEAYEEFCGLPPTEEGEAMLEGDITPHQLQSMLSSGQPPFVLDVREDFELDICRLDGTHHIPLGNIQERLHEIPHGQEIVVHCKMGGRSAQAIAFLQAQGFRHVYNLNGGILRWIDDINPDLQRY